jgi:hypothetical protein
MSLKKQSCQQVSGLAKSSWLDPAFEVFEFEKLYFIAKEGQNSLKGNI